MRIVFDDGGRAAAGLSPSTDDCATRAIAIVTGKPYREVHAALGELAQNWARSLWPPLVGEDIPDIGVPPTVAAGYLESLGWHGMLNRLGAPGDEWHATLSDLPVGRYVIEYRTRTSGHLVAFVDGELRDGPVRVARDFLREPMFGWWSKGPQLRLSQETHSVGNAGRARGPGLGKRDFAGRTRETAAACA